MTTKNAMPFNIDVTKIMGDFKLPLIDIQQWVAIQQRNVEAAVAASKIAAEGVQTLMRRQAELVKSSIEDATSMVTEVTAAGTPEDKIARHIDRMKQAYESALTNCKELADLASTSSSEAADLLASRVSTSLEEIKGCSKKPHGKKAA